MLPKPYKTLISELHKPKPDIRDRQNQRLLQLLYTDPPDQHPSPKQPSARWLRYKLNSSPLSRCRQSFNDLINPQQVHDRQITSQLLELINATTSPLHQLPVELLQHISSFLPYGSALCFSATCRWMAAVHVPRALTLEDKWCIRRGIFKERWNVVAELEDTRFLKEVLLCYRCMRPHKYTEFSGEERRKSASGRWCMWGPEERRWYKRTGCLYYTGEETMK